MTTVVVWTAGLALASDDALAANITGIVRAVTAVTIVATAAPLSHPVLFIATPSVSSGRFPSEDRLGKTMSRLALTLLLR
jgi:hypothetical protein